MQRERLTTAMVAAISLPALGLGVGAVTPAANAASRAPAVAGHLFSEQAVAVDCQGRPQVRPSSFTLACADASDSLTRLSWANWGSALAGATGGAGRERVRAGLRGRPARAGNTFTMPLP